ncbi:hypothetical protein RND71_029523 [Anisodus tanguticus]|uniref:Uncharacterized protein n=1 Tax=Anisodus tanguticus TaxID=243964 RepID=A0AAE1RDK7_9SOLA|nr:hypothetical protein RND71_029523 [Anisodus tanguticus]
MFVKIVHPGGHVELHDRPILAAEIINRNPKSWVCHPTVFQQPWAILPPETTLMPGQKFYVVPINTIKRLQSLALRSSPARIHKLQKQSSLKENTTDSQEGSFSNCWLFQRNSTKNLEVPYSSLRQEKNKDVQSQDEKCFTCLLTGIRINKSSSGYNVMSTETRSSTSSLGSSETNFLNRKQRTMDSNNTSMRVSPTRLSSFDQWHPSLESISEE